MIGHSPCQFSLGGRAYIDQPSSCHFCVSLSFSRPHLYRSIIFRVSLSFRDHTYIDRPSSCQFVFSLSRDRTHIDQSFILPISSVQRPRSLFSTIFRATSSVLAFRAIVHTHPGILDHHCSFILGVQSHSLHLVTWCSLFVHHALLDYPFHYTWHSPLSSRHIFQPCC